jgi:hypothetical protein
VKNITNQYFLAFFPEFESRPPATIDAYIEVATNRVPLNIWGSNGKYATALLTAHMLTISGKSGLGSGGGAVTAESVGDLSRSFATVGVPGSGDQELLTTRYGQAFVALRRETIVSATVTGPTTLPPQPIPGGLC